MQLATGSADGRLSFEARNGSGLPITGLSSWIVRYKLAGSANGLMTTPTIVELQSVNFPGVYQLLVDESEMTTLTSGTADVEELVIYITETAVGTMIPVIKYVEIFRPKTTLGTTLKVASDGHGVVDKQLREKRRNRYAF